MGFQHLFGNAPDVLGSRRRNRSLITLSASSAAKIFRTIAVRMTSMSETKSKLDQPHTREEPLRLAGGGLQPTIPLHLFTSRQLA